MAPIHCPSRVLANVGLCALLVLLGCSRDRSRTAGAADGDGRETGMRSEPARANSDAAPDTAAGPGSGSPLAEADQQLQRAMADSSLWPAYGRDYTNQRFSPLGQITPANAGELKLAWKYKTGVPHAFEGSPVVVNGVMYVSTPLNHVIALDAATGAKKWEHAQELGTTVHCCGAVNRGVAVYDGKVYFGSLDGKLVALDAQSGRKVWEAQIADPNRGFALNAPVLAVDGKILVGTSGGEYGVRGYLEARDARTGREVWRWYSIPSPEEGGWWGKWRETDPFGANLHRDIEKEKADSAKFADSWKTGGGGVWQAPAVDLQQGVVIFTVGNPSPDLDGSERPGDNLYTNCIVAVDYRTGKLKWYFQQIPHDVWDLDTASPAVLVEIKDSAGQSVPAAVQAGKTGWVDMMDRRNGTPLRRSQAFVPQENMFALPTLKGTRMLPGANGGSEWSPAAYSPETGYLYVLGLHQPMNYKVKPEPLKPPAMWLGGAFVSTGEPQYGLFTAVDLNTGKIAWQKRVKDPMIGGAVATAGGVVFTGTKDRQFLAFDAKTGKQLWRYQTHGGVNAPPISYAVNGRQFVAVAAGGNYQINAPRSDELLVFALPSAGNRGAASGAPTGAGAGAGPASTEGTSQ
ncbi:MAG TPA: PQQ-binding-like beta-propeller repeat protein [Gemmatimonadales bacterium]|nr:PQQ-binding-like beta-propeller repeat protein [Gemmatimonadales bacterium]